MTRAPYFLVPLAAIGLLLLVQIAGQARLEHARSTHAPAAAAAPVVVQDPAATAFDDLAAWPAAAGR